MLLYFAAPLFSSAERIYNLSLAKQFESIGYSVFLPQRDGIEKKNTVSQIHTDAEKRSLLFRTDVDSILRSTVFFFLLDGRVPDEGACFELGVAYTQKKLEQTKKLLVGLQTDSRAAFMKTKLNPMLSQAFDTVFQTEEELLQYLRDYFQK